MGRENKNEAVAALHRKQIMDAAEKLFSQNGFEATTIEDISKSSGYSRRTIYAYYKSKEDILHHIIEKGLLFLKEEIGNALKESSDFFTRYKTICAGLVRYHKEFPHSVENVYRAETAGKDPESCSDTVKSIFSLGTEINELLSRFIEEGKKDGIVCSDVTPLMTVYILWSSITAFITLAQTKGQFIYKQFGITEDKFFEYGFRQIINSILNEKI